MAGEGLAEDKRESLSRSYSTGVNALVSLIR